MISKGELGIHGVTTVVTWTSMVVLFLMMVEVTCDVLGRYVLNSPIKGSVDFGELMMAVVVFCGIAYTALTKRHVRVDLVSSRVSPRIRRVLDSVAFFISAGIYSLIAWQLGIRAWEDVVSPPGEITQLLYIPLAPFIFVAAFGSLMLCLEFLIDFFHALFQETSKQALISSSEGAQM
jgi:TRAP-type C4-dicarboxylate transport system permease small subunit